MFATHGKGLRGSQSSAPALNEALSCPVQSGQGWTERRLEGPSEELRGAQGHRPEGVKVSE